MSSKIYETIGTVIKEEKISVVENETFTSALLLESTLPLSCDIQLVARST